MSYLKAFVKKYPKLSAAIGAALIAGAAVYAPGAGAYVQVLLAALFGG